MNEANTFANGERAGSEGGAESARRSLLLVLLCSAAYLTSYLTRKCYDASILAICDATGLARTAAGLASMAGVALYGFGQFVTGPLADRFDPRRIVLVALLLTAGCNLAMPAVVGRVPAMVALWAANGFAQAMFWPPLVKLVAVNLPIDRYRSAIFWISVSCHVAIVSVFVLVSGCTRFASWRLSFAIVAAAAFAMAAVWAGTVRRLAPGSGGRPGRAPARPEGGGGENSPAERIPFGRLLLLSGLLPVLGAIVCQGVLRDGIEVWASSIVKDQYGLGTSGSILSVALLPVFAVASMAAARGIRRWLGDEIRTALLLFATALACSAPLFATNGGTLALGLPVLALLSAAMHGANLMLIGELPGRFARHGSVGTVSGLLNAFTYVGAGLAIYGFPALHARLHGWRPVFGAWMAVLFLGCVLLLLALRRWIPFRKSSETPSA